MANIVFEPVNSWKFGLKCRTSENNIFIMQLPGEFSPFIEKKVVFCLVVGGGLPLPTPLVVRPLKKSTFFMCVFPYRHHPLLNHGTRNTYRGLYDDVTPPANGISIGDANVKFGLLIVDCKKRTVWAPPPPCKVIKIVDGAWSTIYRNKKAVMNKQILFF